MTTYTTAEAAIVAAALAVAVEQQVAAGCIPMPGDPKRFVAFGEMSELRSLVRPEIEATDADIDRLRTAYASNPTAENRQAIADAYWPRVATPAQPIAPVVDESDLRDAVAESLRGNYYCGHVWNAWSVGNMSEADFSPSEEVDECIDQVMDAVRPFLAAQPIVDVSAPTDERAAFEAWLCNCGYPICYPSLERDEDGDYNDSDYQSMFCAWQAARAAAPVSGPTDAERFKRMFTEACADLGAISDALGIDANIHGGADPILEAIESLRAAAPMPSRFDLEAIDRAMQHMGDQLNEMDAAEEGDEQITTPGFEAIARLLDAEAAPVSGQGATLPPLPEPDRYAQWTGGSVMAYPPEGKLANDLQVLREAFHTYMACPTVRNYDTLLDAIPAVCDSHAPADSSSAAPSDDNAWLAAVREEVAKLEKYRLCMSYNDSYFTEPAGTVKRATRNLAMLMDRLPFATPSPTRESLSAGSAAAAWKGLVDQCIAVLRSHTEPDGISDHDALGELYGILDGDGYRNIADIPQERCDDRQREEMNITKWAALAAPRQPDNKG